MLAEPQWAAGVHHDGSAVFVSNPLPALGETVTLRLRTPQDAPLNYAYIRAMIDGEYHWAKMTVVEETAISRLWEGTLTATQSVIDYCFKLMADDGAYYYNAVGITRADSPDYYSFSLLSGYDAPAWVRDTVFYQIFPERFNNGDPSNDTRDGQFNYYGYPTIQRKWGERPYPWRQAGSMDYFGGDLQGITRRLDYLQELGVNAIYLTPIFHATTNHKYDIIDFDHVDPHFGGDAALVELREALDARGMRLILDITTNHIGREHPWYKAALEDSQAETADYFAYDPETGSIETWLGVPLLIKLNYDSQGLRDAMYRAPDSALRRWLQPPYRIDGWRMDVANMTGNLRMSQLDHEVWKEARPYLKQENPDAYLLGEYFMDGTPHTQGDELDAAMNYQGFNIPVRRWLGGEDLGVHDGHPYGDKRLMPSDAVAHQWRRFMAAVPYAIALQQFNQLGSHDTTRILHVADENKALALLGATLLMSFPGVPCVYYGDEIGMTGGKDPDNRRCMPWDEAEWDKTMRAHYQRCIAVRHDSPALKHGGFQLLAATGDVLAFQRHAPEQTVIVVAYRGTAPSGTLTIPAVDGGHLDGATFKDLLDGGSYTVSEGVLKVSGLAQGQALLLELQ